MNRIFPGRPDGSVTEKIADYVHRTLVPMADIVLDFHSGGRTLDFLPFAASHILPDKEQEARCRAARDAFGAPYAMSMLEIDAAGMFDTAVEAAQAAGAVGARMTGGGFGGAAIALVAEALVDDVTAAVLAAFAARGFREPTVFAVAASAGAGRDA